MYKERGEVNQVRMSSAKIHPTAVVDSHAQLAADCEVGPYCVIGPNVKLGEGCRLHSHVVMDGLTSIGPRCEFFPFACIGLKTQDLKFAGGKCYLDIGSDNVFREHVTVHTATGDGLHTRIGSHNNFLAYAHIAHDCVVGDHVIFSNCGTLAGHVLVEDYAIVGGLAAIHQFCRIGTMAIIGGCAKVVQDVPPYMMADGNPAEARGVNKVGLERNGVSEEAQRALREAFKIMFRGGLTVSNALDKIQAGLPATQELRHFIDFCRKSERGIAR
ncbi:MAG TPA: acyl-ACP--UDP-N-acetylglucosamine O-acyltransferase [Verrucomicrobiae bacterium]|nr:acyl-ACP--UDP-N-acetylglucosamine O-acyltransferase [Verrucomicrobiae bacterium]